ncbi:hypothetical protein Cgig2_028997 [Carnegiea gigantea]|uniref:Reverse transcriptase zinc-binding domain-containing protein n=1 Tax=Carnegiea gigantea TaxID=171969 RepID=A0A9Q1JYZ8_9CARY|nr:hypothetical protein Cgig2_028997 [Carnegiea gigantea]
MILNDEVVDRFHFQLGAMDILMRSQALGDVSCMRTSLSEYEEGLPLRLQHSQPLNRDCQMRWPADLYQAMGYSSWGSTGFLFVSTELHHEIYAYGPQKLPVRCRIARFSTQNAGLECALCEEEDEDMDHLFFSCRSAKEYWQAIKQWSSTNIVTSSTSSFMHSILNLKGPKREKMIAYAIYTAGIYQIWRARNENIFAQQ